MLPVDGRLAMASSITGAQHFQATQLTAAPERIPKTSAARKSRLTAPWATRATPPMVNGWRAILAGRSSGTARAYGESGAVESAIEAAEYSRSPSEKCYTIAVTPIRFATPRWNGTNRPDVTEITEKPKHRGPLLLL